MDEISNFWKTLIVSVLLVLILSIGSCIQREQRWQNACSRAGGKPMSVGASTGCFKIQVEQLPVDIRP